MNYVKDDALKQDYREIFTQDACEVYLRLIAVKREKELGTKTEEQRACESIYRGAMKQVINSSTSFFILKCPREINQIKTLPF